MDELEKQLLEEYKNLSLMCGCEEMPYEQYRLFRLRELNIMIT